MYLSALYKKILIVLSLPIILEDYFKKSTGQEYGIGSIKKLLLIYKIARNNQKIKSGTDFIEHLVMITKIFKIPPTTPGSVIECGTYKGASTCNLSIACALVGRRLEIFDSFQGLPNPKTGDKTHQIPDLSEIHTYSKGSWKAGLSEVKKNITKYGEISACSFHPGYFANTLPKFKNKSVLIFCDVDLRSSLETCLKYLWPNLQNGCCFFTHEAHHLEIASLFFDKIWFMKNLKISPPGLIGAGTGLGLIPANNSYKSSIGYTIKNPNLKKYKKMPQTGV